MWETNIYCLTDLGTVSRGRSRHRPRDDESLYGGEYPFVQTGDIKNANFYLTKYSQTYNEKGLLQSKLWKKGTLCITIAANIAETAILGIDACFPDSIVGFIPFENIADVRYIKYYFDMFKKHMQAISLGATQDNFSVDKMLKVKFTIPSFPTQQKIADILSAYDDLIENNNRRIELLEKVAQDLYKEWFVRFRFPNYKETKFENGLPKGWIYIPIEEVMDTQNGKGIQLNDEGVFNVYGSNGIIGKFTDYNNEDALIIGRVGAYCGSVFYDKNKFWATDNTIVVKSKSIKVGNLLAFFTLRSLNISNFAGGSAQPLITQTLLKRIKILIPTTEINKEFDQMVTPIFERVRYLKTMNINLIKQRDLLLPHLMSGKLEV